MTVHNKMIANALRHLAEEVSVMQQPRDLKGVYVTLGRITELLNLACYSYQKKLIQNVARDLDPIEVNNLINRGRSDSSNGDSSI